MDACEELGLVPAAFTAATAAGLREALPEFAAPQNPVDLTAQILTDPGMLMRVLPLLEADPGVDIILFQVAVWSATIDAARFVREVASVAGRTRKVVAVSCPARPVVDRFRAAGVLAFDDPSTALRSLGCLAAATRERARWIAATADSPPPAGGPLPAVGRPSGEGFLSEWDSCRLLAPFALPLVETVLVASPDEAAAAAARLGYPVALKACSADLSQPLDVGGIARELGDAPAVRAAVARVAAALGAGAPGVALQGFLVRPVLRGELQLAVRVKRDPTFGPVIVVGAGGPLADVLPDVRLLLLPIDRAAAERALRGLRPGPSWDGSKGGAPFDLEAAAELLVRLGEAAGALGSRVAEISLNPVIVGLRGEGVRAMDALVRLPCTVAGTERAP